MNKHVLRIINKKKINYFSFIAKQVYRKPACAACTLLCIHAYPGGP